MDNQELKRESEIEVEKIEKDVAFRYLKELLEALSFIHQKGVIHGDISKDNIFIDAHDQVKIEDFGSDHGSFRWYGYARSVKRDESW
ncbi:hypothetical protein K7X08_012551 [Anisodus acutangulus]|uniref:non-specific serine/threonine protein kinase n=1 Tax=Anisodus acutangulus TaxID=402998 RepID=A0A9Q1R0G8_9SOLA|nr:hypothetical protein K7X08_012551 [Anisodus acutangulus]